MAVNNFYFDDPEGELLSRETSHPDFVKNITEEFYYDCTDDLSPFGNDTGADILRYLEDWYRDNEGKGDILKWLFETIDGYGFTYASEGCSGILDETVLKQLESENPSFILAMDQSIVAAAFGQFKITGKINPQLKAVTHIALKRQKQLNYENPHEFTDEMIKRLKLMSRDFPPLLVFSNPN